MMTAFNKRQLIRLSVLSLAVFAHTTGSLRADIAGIPCIDELIKLKMMEEEAQSRKSSSRAYSPPSFNFNTDGTGANGDGGELPEPQILTPGKMAKPASQSQSLQPLAELADFIKSEPEPSRKKGDAPQPEVNRISANPETPEPVTPVSDLPRTTESRTSLPPQNSSSNSDSTSSQSIIPGIDFSKLLDGFFKSAEARDQVTKDCERLTTDEIKKLRAEGGSCIQDRAPGAEAAWKQAERAVKKTVASLIPDFLRDFFAGFGHRMRSSVHELSYGFSYSLSGWDQMQMAVQMNGAERLPSPFRAGAVGGSGRSLSSNSGPQKAARSKFKLPTPGIILDRAKKLFDSILLRDSELKALERLIQEQANQSVSSLDLSLPGASSASDSSSEEMVSSMHVASAKAKKTGASYQNSDTSPKSENTPRKSSQGPINFTDLIAALPSTKKGFRQRKNWRILFKTNL